METELKDLNSNSNAISISNSNSRPPELEGAAVDRYPSHDEASTKDDRPLLKSPPISHISSSGNLQDLEKKYGAFVRYDVYGIMGRGELSRKEKALLGLALVTLVPIRMILCFALLFIYYLICRICTMFYSPNEEEEQEDYAHMDGFRRSVIIQSGKVFSRLILFVLGFYWISVTYRFPNTGNKPTSEVFT